MLGSSKSLPDGPVRFEGEQNHCGCRRTVEVVVPVPAVLADPEAQMMCAASVAP